ncbi:MAG: hypothetical protein ACRDKT_08435 [Actinomycetota bacterium]
MDQLHRAERAVVRGTPRRVGRRDGEPVRTGRRARRRRVETEWDRLLGRKVSVRFRLHDDPAHPFSEAIGVVMSVEEGVVTLVNKRGEERKFPVADVLTAKVFPP